MSPGGAQAGPELRPFLKSQALADRKREIVRSCHFTKEVKIFCENLELFGPYLAFLTKMSGNTT